MGANNAEVSSVALTGLQTDLTSLSNTLHEIYDLMNADMNQVKEFWQDPKYEEFRNGYSKQIKHCEDVSVRYSEWCNKILTPAIDKVVEIERADVGGDGGGISSMGAGAGAGATAGAAAAAGASAKNSKTSRFNTGKKTSVAQKSSTDKKNPAVTTSPSAKSEKKKFETDGALEEADNLCRHLEGNEHSQAISAKDPNAKNVKMMEFNVSNVGGEWNAGGEVNAKAAKVIKNVVDIEGKVQADYHSGKKSSNVTFKVPFDCSTPENDN